MREQLPESRDSVMTIHTAWHPSFERNQRVKRRHLAPFVGFLTRLRHSDTNQKLHPFDTRITAQYDSQATNAGSDME